jgi:hypothetical protein
MSGPALRALLVGTALTGTSLAAAPVAAVEPPSVAPASATTAPSTPDLRGAWRMDLSLTTKATIPVLGDTIIQTGSVYLVEIVGTPEAPIQQQTVCSITPDGSRSIATTTIPPGFIDAMPDKRFALTLRPDGAQWAVSGDMKMLAIGYDLDKAGGSIPQEAEHVAVTDHEGDGHPGATVHLKAPLFGQVEVYMLQRARTTVAGTWDGRDRIDGKATVLDFGQRTIGASNRLFVANPKLEAVPETSTWRMTRVPKGTTCAHLRGGLAAATGG